MLRYGAGNRDDRMYECPADIDLDRKHPRRHLAFGVGTHHCLGAPLARRELLYGFKALVDLVEDMWFIEGANDFTYHQNFFLRARQGAAHRVQAAGRLPPHRNRAAGRLGRELRGELR